MESQINVDGYSRRLFWTPNTCLIIHSPSTAHTHTHTSACQKPKRPLPPSNTGFIFPPQTPLLGFSSPFVPCFSHLLVSLIVCPSTFLRLTIRICCLSVFCCLCSGELWLHKVWNETASIGPACVDVSLHVCFLSVFMSEPERELPSMLFHVITNAHRTRVSKIMTSLLRTHILSLILKLIFTPLCINMLLQYVGVFWS